MCIRDSCCRYCCVRVCLWATIYPGESTINAIIANVIAAHIILSLLCIYKYPLMISICGQRRKKEL